MRGCARVALIIIAVFAGLGLAGCASVDELKNTVSGWFATGKSLDGREKMLAEQATQTKPPEKMLSEEASKPSKKKDKPAQKAQRQQTVELPAKPSASASAEAVKPQGADAQSATSPFAPLRLRTLWPEAPAPGTFSR